ncbi:hypothetical protein [Microcoleus sp. Pol17_C1]|uniref:hypothetical protein n=1 Tax=unclassified Microcoleus TaxID=2642155 RepID=UPI002FCEA303
MLDKLLNLLPERTVSQLAIKLLLNLQTRGVVESDSNSDEEYDYLGWVIKLKWSESKKEMSWCIYDRLKEGVSYSRKTALSTAVNWIDNLEPNDPTQLD